MKSIQIQVREKKKKDQWEWKEFIHKSIIDLIQINVVNWFNTNQ
jgi:hypothetical protein